MSYEITLSTRKKKKAAKYNRKQKRLDAIHALEHIICYGGTLKDVSDRFGLQITTLSNYVSKYLKKEDSDLVLKSKL